jgi:hypothetical protein
VLNRLREVVPEFVRLSSPSCWESNPSCGKSSVQYEGMPQFCDSNLCRLSEAFSDVKL